MKEPIVEIIAEPCEPKPFPKGLAQEGEVVLVEMTKAGARRLTDQIKDRASDLAELLYQAHEGRAWKALGYDSWKTYCETEFRMTKQRSYQLLAFVEVKNQIESQQALTPQTEFQARILAKLKPDQRSAAWGRAVDIAGGKQPTAKQVASAVSQAQVPPEPVFVEDDMDPILEQEMIARVEKALEALWERTRQEYPKLTWSIYSAAVRGWLMH